MSIPVSCSWNWKLLMEKLPYKGDWDFQRKYGRTNVLFDLFFILHSVLCTWTSQTEAKNCSMSPGSFSPLRNLSEGSLIFPKCLMTNKILCPGLWYPPPLPCAGPCQTFTGVSIWYAKFQMLTTFSQPGFRNTTAHGPRLKFHLLQNPTFLKILPRILEVTFEIWA